LRLCWGAIASNAVLTRWLSILAGSAYRVTIPAVVQVAYMRIKMNSETGDTTTNDESED